MKTPSKEVKKDNWEKQWKDMWYSPGSTMFNWSGWFQDDGIVQRVFGTYMSAKDKERLLKKSLEEFLFDYIKGCVLKKP